MAKEARIRLESLDPQDPLALKIKEALVAEDDKAKGLVPTGVQVALKFAVKVPDKAFMSGFQNFDSSEEYEFHEWCREAGSAGLIAECTYHPEPFKLSARKTYEKLVQLKTKTKRVDAFLFHPHEYTADFMLDLTDKGKKFLYDRGLLHTPYPDHMWIDVKGGFSMYHDEKQFVINQKWVYDKFQIYVYKVVPRKWFPRTWAPRAARYSPKKGKLRDCYRGTETLETIKEKL